MTHPGDEAPGDPAGNYWPPQQTPPRKRGRTGLIVAAGAALVVIAGAIALVISRDDPAPTVAPFAATGAASPSASPSQPPSAVPTTAQAPGFLKLGDKRRVDKDGFVVEVAALKVRSGDGFEGVQVRTCNRGDSGGEPVSVSRGPWTLGYDDFEQLHDIDITGGGLPAPAYEDRELQSGECSKGWVNFTDVSGERPDGIQYAPEGVTPIRWSFSRK